MDKIDMSLDDIIKQQRKEKAKQAKKKVIVTKYRKGGSKVNQAGVSPLNRTMIKPSSIVNGRRAYSARYIKPFQLNSVGRKSQGRGGKNRNTQVKGQLKQKANQRQRQFNQRRGLNTQVNTNKANYQTKRAQTGNRGRGQANRGRGRQVNNANRTGGTNNAGRGRQAVRGRGRQVNRQGRVQQMNKVRQTNYAGRGRQTVVSGRRGQAMNRGKPANKGRIQQPIKTMKTKSQPAMLKVSINNTSSSRVSNAPVKLKRNTFINRKPSTLNERFSNFQRGSKQKQSNITERTVLF